MLWKILLITIVLWLILRRWKKRRQMQCCGQFKNDLRAIPGLGQSYMMIGNGEVKMNAIQCFGREAIKQGGITSIFQSWLIDRYFLVVADPVIAEFIMKKCLEKGDTMKVFDDIFGNTLMELPVDEWRPRRKVLNPAFSLKNLNNFVDVFKKNSNILLSYLRDEADIGPITVNRYVAAFTLDSVCETMLGAELGCLHDKNHPVMEAVKTTCELLSNRMCQPWLHNSTVYEMTSQCAILKQKVDLLYAFIRQFTPSNLKTEETNQNGSKLNKTNYTTVLQLLMECSNNEIPLTEKYILNETLLVTLAGMDTMAITMSFLLKLLARHQNIQEKVYDEITKTLDHPEKELETVHLPQLKYMEAVIKETLRLYPPGVALLRKIDEDVVLPNGKTLVKDIGILINVWAIHRHPDYWGPDPDTFRPERWEDGTPHPGAFLGFSTGMRNCIGYQYAMMSMKTCLTTILRNFQITSANKCENINGPFRVTFDIMMRDADGCRIQLESR